MENFDINYKEKNNGMATGLASDIFSPSALINPPNTGNGLAYRKMVAYPQNSGVAIASPVNNYALNLSGAVTIDFIQNNNGSPAGFTDNVISSTGLINPVSATGYIQLAPASQISDSAISSSNSTFNPIIQGEHCSVTNGNFVNSVSAIGQQTAVIALSKTSSSYLDYIFNKIWTSSLTFLAVTILSSSIFNINMFSNNKLTINNNFSNSKLVHKIKLIPVPFKKNKKEKCLKEKSTFIYEDKRKYNYGSINVGSGSASLSQ